jgi:Pyruvate/2-oxoacid:ferredoxin oxidoreductase delta subunit
MRQKKGCGDEFLAKRLAKIDLWLEEGKIPTSSKVIPIQESLKTQQCVLPTEQAVEILRNSKSFALTECLCRSHYKRCDNPLDVCFILDEAADKYVADGRARHISLNEAKHILQKANEAGLVHLTVFIPDHAILAFCSCCQCCCHDLQFLKLYGRNDLITHSGYITSTQEEQCIHCGACVDRCVFGARIYQDKKMNWDAGNCYGCGLCVTVCSENAISMQKRSKAGISAK